MSRSLGGCVNEWVLSLTLAAIMDGEGCFLHAYGSAGFSSACYGVFIRCDAGRTSALYVLEATCWRQAHLQVGVFSVSPQLGGVWKDTTVWG